MSRQQHYPQANNELRFALNELKAIQRSDSLSDRESIVRRLTWLAKYIEDGGPPPDAHAIIIEAEQLPVQE